MRATRVIVRWGILLLFLVSGCSREHPDEPIPNKTPHTYMWLFPDSIIAQGVSKQHVRWWGEDPDGIVKGFLFAIGKIGSGGSLPSPDTLRWTWTTKNDTLIALPLLTKRDTFTIAVRGVDNHFTVNLP